MIAADCTGTSGTSDETPPASASETPPAAASAAPSGPLPKLRAEEVAHGFTRPTFVTHAGDGSGRLFVVEKPGRIRVIRNGAIESQPFLDITSVVQSSGNEQGLLGLAFHPGFASNGRFFVGYTGRDGTNTFAEYRVNGGKGDPTTARVLLAIPDKYPNHNGGMLAFGKDGFLYLSTGDGGSAGDPDGNGQNLGALPGKLLRIDVDATARPYGIPASNPFVSRTGARPETWAYGLRNPWRFSFDRATGDLWIADVGQNAYEEVDRQPADSKGGENYGWSTMEGTHCYGASTCDRDGKTLPVHEYSHSLGCSITGGYVYRGTSVTALAGAYLYVDYCRGDITALRRQDGVWKPEVVGKAQSISAFGEDEAGELYLAGDSSGIIYRLAAAPVP
ncbi:MAG: PQQ-dependent sugar dehydrogenase [Dehalococcoidia bacterium]|nr:PQQ-dependent sugar dehydrogenase [Dehalococcoidia bacterium]